VDRRYPISTIIALIFLAVFVSGGMTIAQEPRALRVNGAGMASDLVQKWAQEFTAGRPGMPPVVVTGSSAGAGFKAFMEGNADLALLSRPLLPDEQKSAADKGYALGNKLVGYAGMAVFTNRRNPVNELTMEQLRKMYTGKLTNWKDVGGTDAAIRCFTRKVPESGGAVFFQEHVMNKEPFGSNALILGNWMEIQKICSAATDLPIGMGPVQVVKPEEVKIIAVKQDENSKAVAPTDQTLKDKSYPIILPFYLCWNTKVNDPRIPEFVKYCEEMGLGKK
jgi:phosphate transport system substrate-binding protein